MQEALALLEKHRINPNQPIFGQTIWKHAARYPHVVQALEKQEVKAILEGGYVPSKSPWMLKRDKGIYQWDPEPIGRGGWGEVYAAHHYTLEEGEVIASEPLAIKKMSAHHAIQLSKEYQLFQQAYPEKFFAQLMEGSYAYFVMPRFPGVPLDRYLLEETTLTTEERQHMAVDFLSTLAHIHEMGVTHHDAKPKNILYDPATKKMHIVDFGCAEALGAPMQFKDINTAKYAIEYMPPEYVHGGTRACIANDTYSITLTLAEILGMDKRELVRNKLVSALRQVPDGSFKQNILAQFEKQDSLDQTVFSMTSFWDRPEFKQFIDAFVREPYDFSAYADTHGAEVIQLLNAMQHLNPEARPSTQACLERLLIIKNNDTPSKDFRKRLKYLKDDSLEPPPQPNRSKPL
jgi:serine/threonine protein kinase